jgi:hypothetical protein
MKPISALWIFLLAIVATAHGDEPAAIPFDAAKAKKVLEARRSATLANTLDAYKSVGKQKAAWDKFVERAMRDQVEGMHGPTWDRVVAGARAKEWIAIAVEAGCDDPMVRYLHAKLASGPSEESDSRNATLEEAVKALAASKYPDLLKIDAWLSLISAWRETKRSQDLTQDEQKIIAAALDEALKLLAKACANRKPNQRDELIQLCQLVYKHGQKAGERKKWFDRLRNDLFGTLERNDLIAHVVTGMFLVEYAWEARGTGPGAKLTPAQVDAFRERLKDAQEHLTRAWELDNECSAAAMEMIQVCMGANNDRDEMETWLRRAITADPLNFKAFEAKMLYLHPKWHGSEKDMLEFGRQILKAGQWDYAHPMIALTVYFDLIGSRRAPAYFRQHPDIWKQVETIIEEIRKRYPMSPIGASTYLFVAWLSERNAKQASEYVKASRESGANLPIGMFKTPVRLRQALDWLKESLEKGDDDK